MDKRKWYSELKYLKESGAHKGVLKLLYDEKVRLLRRENKLSDYYGLDDEVVVMNFPDIAIIRKPLGIIDKDAKYEAECLAEAFRINYRPTYYDCTGQLYTRWQEVHYMAGQWWLWQCNCVDI